MRTRILITLGLALLMPAVLNTSCEFQKTYTDAEKLANLRHVSISYDGVSYDISLPAGVGSGQSFADLLLLDSATYANPANYSISLSIDAVVDNTDPGETDAKFDGMYIDMVMGDLASEPIRAENPGFDVLAGQTKNMSLATTINLQTHRASGLYIFGKVADGEDLEVTMKPVFLYEIGSLEGEIPLPSVTRNVPTSASPETKSFLRQLLDSGLFNER